MHNLTSLLILTSGLLIISCSGNKDNNPQPALFSNPIEVAITGYAGSAMEPFISEDGISLFFNNPTEGNLDGDIHYAQLVSDNTFQYIGLVEGVNTGEFEGAASMDSFGNFYYTSLAGYQQTLLSIYGGSFTFSNGQVVNPVAVDQNLTLNQPGMVDMDAVISSDGETLILAIGKFTTNTFPDEASFIIANKVNGVFTKLTNSDELLVNINTGLLEYAASLSANGLELFFNRTDLTQNPFEFTIMVATRASQSEPFGVPQKIEAISGDAVEGACVTADGKELYYHQKINGVFKIFKVTRN
jgi:hypothetical protein